MSQLEKTFLITESQLLSLQNELKVMYETSLAPTCNIENMLRVIFAVKKECPVK